MPPDFAQTLSLAEHQKAAGYALARELDGLYAFTGLARFRHDFDNIVFDTAEFDARLGTPGLHRVRRKAERLERQTVLPPDLWQRHEGASIWRNPEFNTQGVVIGCDRWGCTTTDGRCLLGRVPGRQKIRSL